MRDPFNFFPNKARATSPYRCASTNYAGTSGYQRGCRCDGCRAFYSAYSKAAEARRKGAPKPSLPVVLTLCDEPGPV